MSEFLQNEKLKGVDPNVIVKLVADLLPVIIQFGLPLVEKVITSIKEDPSLPVDGLKDTLLKRLEEASQKNQAILDQQQ
jgi:hypothetical protein